MVAEKGNVVEKNKNSEFYQFLMRVMRLVASLLSYKKTLLKQKADRHYVNKE